MIDKQLYYKYLFIDYYSVTPLYIQLSNAIVNAIKDGYLAHNDSLPSLNELSNELELAKDTVEKAYGILKKKKIIGSVAGKGYFVLDDNLDQNLKILLLFNKLSAHKKIIYDAFVATLAEKGAISFYIYNNDFYLFKKILQKKLQEGGYTHYVIIPHFFDQEDKAIELINTSIPKDKLVLLDKNIPEIKHPFAAVYQDFEKNIYDALSQTENLVEKYENLKIVFPTKSYHPQAILNGFEHFCTMHNIPFSVLSKVEQKDITKGSLFITLMEDDLVSLVEKTIALGYTVGKDIGIISYNEVAIKKLILQGITTFSTDFEMMGRETAERIINNKEGYVAIPFSVTARPSI
ncbi:MAG: GntR family transcriptional regulator [Chitinophagaceae bacterium]